MQLSWSVAYLPCSVSIEIRHIRSSNPLNNAWSRLSHPSRQIHSLSVGKVAQLVKRLNEHSLEDCLYEENLGLFTGVICGRKEGPNATVSPRCLDVALKEYRAISKIYPSCPSAEFSETSLHTSLRRFCRLRSHTSFATLFSMRARSCCWIHLRLRSSLSPREK